MVGTAEHERLQSEAFRAEAEQVFEVCDRSRTGTLEPDEMARAVLARVGVVLRGRPPGQSRVTEAEATCAS